MKNKTIIGKFYSTRSNAQRSINRFITQNFAALAGRKNKVQFFINQLDWGCYEIEGIFLNQAT